MANLYQKFAFTIPAQLEKAEDGQWRVYGLASTKDRDQQDEVVDVRGLDLSPIEKGRGIFNFDHKKGPENTIGVIDAYKKSNDGLYLGGYLFKNHDRAKAVHSIMSSLTKSDRGRMGMSIEGVIQKRDGKENKTIAKAKITSCALTMNPVNTDTYVDLVKSMNEVEFETESLILPTIPQGESFTPQQVASLLKALGVGAGYANTIPSERTQGDALSQEDLDSKKKKKKRRLKRMDKKMYKSAFIHVIEHLRKLHPEASTTELYEAIKERLNTKFPKLKI